jgi:hypothetical protein
MSWKRFGAVVAAVAAAGFAAAAVGAAGGPSPGVQVGWDGLTAPNGKVRYVALVAGRVTVLAKVRVRGGRVVQYGYVKGYYGIPQVAFDGSTDGLTRDGRTLVLALASNTQTVGPRAVSRFALVGTRRLRLRGMVTLRGAFSFDALSPDGKTMYLIEYFSQYTRYRVRAYDLAAGRLLTRVIFDFRLGKRSMRGQPLTRARAPGGAWVYTLYTRQGATPFVHALDAVRRRAVCIDLPWKGSQQKLWRLRMTVSPDGKRILLRGGGIEKVIETPA